MPGVNKFVVIVHGKEGSPDSGWIPWLKQQLSKKNFSCAAPLFPPENDSKLADWLVIFGKIQFDLSRTTFIAHARGAMALLRWINTLPSTTKINKIIAVACNFDYQPDRRDGDAFYSSRLDYEDIKRKCKTTVIIHSKDDPYVPVEAGKELAKNLNAKFVVFDKAGHFGSDKVEALEILNEII